ncbi:MAG: hypothetical protein ACOC34_02355, partial [Thermotogota bacterium]
MFYLNYFLAHTVADYAFTNPMKLYGERRFTELIKHLIWVILVFLAFSFDIIFTSPFNIVVFIIALMIHFHFDFFRIKKFNPWTVELSSMVAFLLYAFAFSKQFTNSFITSYFSFYLIGMLCVSVIPTQIMRMSKLIDPLENESEGISERLAMFIFICAGQYLFAGAVLLIALVYRLIVKKKVETTW